VAVNLSPFFQEPWVDASGDPLTGYQLFTYTAGSSTKEATYTASDGLTAQANPIILNSSGYPANPIWLTAGVSYKFVLATAADTDPPTGTVITRDNIDGINDTAAATVDQWITGPAPTYVSATQFTLVGDQTSTFTVGRKVKTTNTAGSIYSTISVSAFTTLTTITVVNESGTLDSGLSAVSYGILTSTNSAIPGVVNSSLDWKFLGAVVPTVDSAKSVGSASLRWLTGFFDKIGDSGQGLDVDSTSLRLTDGVVFVKEQAAADADQAGYGQIWVELLTPNRVKFTDDAGTDFNLVNTLGTVDTTTGGTSLAFTGIPAGIKEITMLFSVVSTTGTSPLQIQIGDAGGLETSGYVGACRSVATTVVTDSFNSGFIITSAAVAAESFGGFVTLKLIDAANFIWACSFAFNSGTRIHTGSGTKTLTAELDRLSFTTEGGSDTIDVNGGINIQYS